MSTGQYLHNIMAEQLNIELRHTEKFDILSYILMYSLY